MGIFPTAVRESARAREREKARERERESERERAVSGTAEAPGAFGHVPGKCRPLVGCALQLAR